MDQANRIAFLIAKIVTQIDRMLSIIIGCFENVAFVKLVLDSQNHGLFYQVVRVFFAMS